MKTINVQLEDKEYKIANKNRKGKTWKEVIMGVTGIIPKKKITNDGDTIIRIYKKGFRK